MEKTTSKSFGSCVSCKLEDGSFPENGKTPMKPGNRPRQRAGSWQASVIILTLPEGLGDREFSLPQISGGYTIRVLAGSTHLLLEKWNASTAHGKLLGKRKINSPRMLLRFWY